VRVDAHHHFWDPARGSYPWMTDDLAKIRRPFGPADLAPLLRETGVDRTVVVQARMDVAETRDLLEVAAATDFVAGVVGWVDLTDDRVAGTLRELRASPVGAKLVGIRHQVHDEQDPAWLLRPEVRRGLTAVGDAGLAYDLLVRTRELPAALEIARLHPDLRLVVDHLAKPPIANGDDAGWAAALAPFADLGHVHCKLSGMVTEADWSGWRPEDLAPYVRQALDWFGPERCMFGSDWPVCLLAASYGQVLEALVYALGDIDEQSKAAVLGENAIRFYRLDGA
jgi:L-fuconolactonase